jgi:hypothetical protein
MTAILSIFVTEAWFPGIHSNPSGLSDKPEPSSTKTQLVETSAQLSNTVAGFF